MYIVFDDQIIDSKDIKELIEKNSEFKVVKDNYSCSTSRYRRIKIKRRNEKAYNTSRIN
ncbi:hypothetical protein [Clostridium thailandense]|uniref:hypothetical protein n=1 Tax=Clostridium thailandense TaxID=2794346 RepID=UPI003988C6AA